MDWHRLDIWEVYRREDLGFEVELPGKPDIEEGQNDDRRWVGVELMFGGMMFGVEHIAFNGDITIDYVSRHQRKAAQTLNSKMVRETPFTMGDIAAIEIVTELEDAFVSIVRAVAIGSSRSMSSAGRTSLPIRRHCDF